MAGVLRLEEHIPQLAGILAKPDDTLAGEASTALIAFQSDEVVKAVAPYLAKDDSFVYALSVLEYIKTEASAQVLMNAYNQTDNLANQDMIFEAIAHHYSKDSALVMKKHLENEYQSGMVELEPVAYGYFKILGLHHRDLSFWKQVALENEMEFREGSQTPIVVEEKVGRNDPCICGSGKKNKKCCGK
ncbi:SEC-C domain-containing protein [Bacillus sp. RD4P76]|uniref:SEC-C domain-containing protein n=2 Tax=Bacillus suaedaesalsae TaxID=2810349 RepID=A0ABS2DGK1_9BACI|nr:SEC-C domain-containing protein [Bacillus suaedaesalsae]